MAEYLTLVDKYDNEKGSMEKQLVHELGLLHRAFSVFIFNSKGALLLQQRAENKYHSASKWSNTCCSHPPHGEDLLPSVHKRLLFEMGIECEVNYIFNFIYKAELENKLIEHEFDHIYFGICDDTPKPRPEEVKNWRYATVNELQNEVSKSPDEFTEWLKLLLPEIITYTDQFFKRYKFNEKFVD